MDNNINNKIEYNKINNKKNSNKNNNNIMNIKKKINKLKKKSKKIELFTYWFNYLLYLIILYTLISKDYSIIRSYLILAIPICIIGEYLLWDYRKYNKSKLSFNNALKVSIIYHWSPLILYLYSNNYKYKNNLNLNGLYLGIFIFVIYFGKFNKKIKNIYGIRNITEFIFVCIFSILMTIYLNLKNKLIIKSNIYI